MESSMRRLYILFESGPDLFIRLCQPLIAPGLLLFLSPFMDGDLGTKGFYIES